MATVKIFTNIPLTNDSVARIKSDPLSLLNQLEVYEKYSFTVSYVKGGVIEIPAVAYDLDDCNYLCYNNGGMWHFAFIDDVIWTSHRSCAISFTEDYFTSYSWKVALGRGRLLQTNSSEIDSNTYRLRMAGDYIPQHFTPLSNPDELNVKISEWGFLIGLANPANLVSEAVIIGHRSSTLPSAGMWLYFDNVIDLVAFTTAFDFNPLVSEEDILGIYAVPKFIGNQIPVDLVPYTNPTQLLETAKVLRSGSPLEWSYSIITEDNRNSKRYKDLWRSPYSYVDVELLGDHYTFAPEELSDDLSTLGNVKLKFALTAKPTLTLVMDGLRTSTSYNPIVLGSMNLPEIPFSITQVSGWATGEGLLNIAQNVVSSGSLLGGVVKGIAQNPMRTSVRNSGTAPTAQEATGEARIYVKVIMPTAPEVLAIEEDLKRYGFRYNTPSSINLNTVWNGAGSIGWDSTTSPLYMQCEDVAVNGEISQGAQIEIKSALSQGVRIYNNIADLKAGTI